MTTETLTVTTERTPLDLLLFRRFRREVPGLVEAVLALNPGLAARGPYLPLGAQILVEIPAPASEATPPALVRLYD